MPNPVGERYGYDDSHLDRNCYVAPADLKADYEAVFSDGEPVPAHFSCLTYNIWGLGVTAVQQHLVALRADLLVSTIQTTDADLCFLQEMSAYAYGAIVPPLRASLYKYASEEPYIGSNRNRNVEVYCLSKYKPSRIRVIGIDGVLSYKNSFMVVEWPNLVVINLYNQAGSRKSPGQEENWHHYSRCRRDILQTLFDLLLGEKDRPILLCGDFNFDLDGATADWPEMASLALFKANGFVDTFRSVCRDPGYTEDTVANPMRWNHKRIEKQYRYDGIFSKGLHIKSSMLIGQASRLLSPLDSVWFLTEVSDPLKADTEVRGLILDQIPIAASDHFGVLTLFS